MDTSTTQKLTCRKCSGNHLTAKCGKDNKPSIFDSSESKISIDNSIEEKQDTPFKPRFDRKPNFDKPSHFEKRVLHKVRINNLPVDITEPELMELLFEWGHVVRLRVLAYTDNAVAYVEFAAKEEADYFVEALHKTSFERTIIHVERLLD